MITNVQADYLNGDRLHGDDFSQDQIAEWYADEREGYADLGAKHEDAYRYKYHAWNIRHGYRHLPDISFNHVLGFGSAYGDEFLPIIDRVRAVTILEPSEAFVRPDVHGVPATFVKPRPDGRAPFQDEIFDLVTCFGVLHHIPNVSFVVTEIARTIKPGGYLLVREPIRSMGDWQRPRPGLTKRERGIPLDLLQSFTERSGLDALRTSLCGFPLTPRFLGAVCGDVYNSPTATFIDSVLCRAFAWNVNYHPHTLLDRFCPSSAFLVLQKPLRTSPITL